MSAFSPKHNYLLLESIEASRTSKGGIFIPESARMKINQGKIIEAAPDVLSAANLKVGEIVIFPYHAEYRLTSDGKEYILIPADQIIAGDNCTTEIEEEKTMPLPFPEAEKKTPSGRKAPLGI